MKTIRIICIAIIGLVMIGCNKQPDTIITDNATTSYLVKNRTNKDIFIKIVYAQATKDGELIDFFNKVTIEPSLTKELYSYSEVYEENVMVKEFEGDVLPVVSKHISVEVYVDNQLVNEALLDKPNWSFSATEYYQATYLLVVTDELIESVGYKSE